MSQPLPVRPPLRFPASRELAIVAALVALLVAASAVMVRLGRPLATPVSPRGIIDFELAGTRERAAEILAAWDEGAREAARVQTRADDFGYIPAYVLAISAAAGAVATRIRFRGLALLGVALAWAMLPAGVFDLVENRQMMAQLASGPDAGRAALARAMASLKFAIVYASLAYALVGALVVAVDRFARRARP